MRRVEKKRIEKALAEYSTTGNLSAVSRKYDIARTTLLRYIKGYVHNEDTSAAVVTAIEKTSEAAVRSIEAELATRQEFLRQHYAEVNKLFAALINKMTTELLDETKHPSLRDQAAALTALANFVNQFTPHDAEQSGIQINLLQQTLNK